MKELEGVVSNCLRTHLLLGLSTRCNHARLQENTLKKDIVLSKVEENLCPDLLGHFKSSINVMLPIKQDLWLHNWDQSIVLKPLKENILTLQNQYKYIAPLPRLYTKKYPITIKCSSKKKKSKLEWFFSPGQLQHSEPDPRLLP